MPLALVWEVVALAVKQGESDLGMKNNVSKTLRRKGPGALRIQDPPSPWQCLFGWRTKRGGE